MWFVGHYGFQYYAERSGMRSTYLWPPPEDAPKRATGWRRRTAPSPRRTSIWKTRPCAEETQLLFTDPVPLRTVSCFYCGRVPLEHHEGPRLTVRIYRVMEDFQPKRAKKLKGTGASAP